MLRKRRRKELTKVLEVKEANDCMNNRYWIWYSYGQEKGYSYRLSELKQQIVDYIDTL